MPRYSQSIRSAAAPELHVVADDALVAEADVVGILGFARIVRVRRGAGQVVEVVGREHDVGIANPAGLDVERAVVTGEAGANGLRVHHRAGLAIGLRAGEDDPCRPSERSVEQHLVESGELLRRES